ncbi:MAG: arylamine N-acetyltransferase [Chromatiales bacterium]|jgi:N-hydroxyarylamine O-acetyltransferase
MNAENFALDAYCDRIGFSGELARDLKTVSGLMRHQLSTVPFENLDVQAGKVVSLIPEEIVAKIIQHRRGGYCYEVNGLFAMALGALGVPYQFIACRPLIYPVLRPRTHMALIVRIEDEPWLCDLGFGSYGIRAPLRLADAGKEIRQGNDTFMLEQPTDHDYLLKAYVEGQWANQYSFDLWPQQWVDFTPANYLNSSHPDSLFVQKLVVLKQHSNGRTTLFGNRLKHVNGDRSQVRMLREDEVGTVLRETFGLTLDL